jgi:tetratricopeptide (TPR) repeat protein
MLKKQRIKLKEQAESITLREAGADAAARPESAAAEVPCDSHTEVAQAPTDLATPGKETDHPETADNGQDITGIKSGQIKPPVEGPIKGKFASRLSDEDLTTLATHPESIEADWLPAFTELEKRAKPPGLPPRKSPEKKYGMLIAVALIAISAASVAVWQSSQTSKAPVSSSAYDPKAPYVLRSAQIQSWQLKQRAVVRLAQAIDSHGWTPARAAGYLGVSEKQITAIMRDGHCPFSMDELDKMLFAIGASTAFPEQATSEELLQTVAYFTKIIALDPQDSRAYDERASAYSNLKQYDLAIADLKRYVELNPDRPGSRTNLAALYQRAGKYQEALQTLNDQHVLFPDEDIYQNRALAYVALGQYDKALADSTKSIKMMDTPRPGPYFNRALVYEKLGRYKEAIADCKKVLEIDPTYAPADKLIAKLKNKP